MRDGRSRIAVAAASAAVQALPSGVLLLLLTRASGKMHAPVLPHSVLQVGAVVLVNRAVVVVVVVVVAVAFASVVPGGAAAAAQQ